AWANWPLNIRGTLAEWTSFLRLAGVKDGLPVHRYSDFGFTPDEWRRFRAGNMASKPFEGNIGPEWRSAVAKAAAHFSYQSREYSAKQVPYFAGQGRFGQFNSRAKHAFAKVSVHGLGALPDELLTTTLRRVGGNSDWVHWPSPLAAFVDLAPWIPASGTDEFEGLRPRDCWYGSKEHPLPRFVRRIDRSIR